MGGSTNTPKPSATYFYSCFFCWEDGPDLWSEHLKVVCEHHQQPPNVSEQLQGRCKDATPKLGHGRHDKDCGIDL